MRYLIAALIFAHTVALSQPYVGARVMRSQQVSAGGGCAHPTYTYCEDTAALVNLYAGYRSGAWALEAGGGELGDRVARNVGTREAGPYDITQRISTRHFYAGALRYFKFAGLNAHVLGGIAWVGMRNHEFGTNENGPGQVQRNESVNSAPIIGAGIEQRLDNRALRLELAHINNVARSRWTGRSEITTVSIGVQHSF